MDSVDDKREGYLAAVELSPQASKFIENFGLFYEQFGMPRIGGRIWGLLLVAGKPLAAEHLAEMLQVARSSISTNMRLLTVNRLADKVTIPGDRRDYYIISPQSWEHAIQAEVQGANAMETMAEQALATMPLNDPATRRNLEDMATLARMIRAAYGQVMEEWRKRPNRHA